MSQTKIINKLVYKIYYFQHDKTNKLFYLQNEMLHSSTLLKSKNKK